MSNRIFAKSWNGINISRDYCILLLILILATLISKCGVFLGGFATDDYQFNAIPVSEFLSQGRVFAGAIFIILRLLDINGADLYLPFGALAIVLHAVFFAAILRFVGVEKIPGAGLIGALMVSYPYGAEIFTFKIALPTYSLALFFSFSTLELIVRNPKSRSIRIFAFFSALSMLFTYQIFFSYFAILVVFSWIFYRLFSLSDITIENENGLTIRDRSAALLIVSFSALVAFFCILFVAKLFDIQLGSTGRAHFISFHMIPERLNQIIVQLKIIYWSAEPVFPVLLKRILLLLSLYSFFYIAKYIYSSNNKKWGYELFLIVVLFTFLVPLSLGVIVAFGDWWPVPRVVSHVSVIVGLLLIAGSYCAIASQRRTFYSLFVFGIMAVIFGFILVGNQIFSDQIKVNNWDKSLADQIMIRLEGNPNFNAIRFLDIEGGRYDYPDGVKTADGDMNISAFYPVGSKVPAFDFFIGSNFERPYGEKALQGESYCSTSPSWPAPQSVKIIGDLAVVCRQK